MTTERSGLWRRVRRTLSSVRVRIVAGYVLLMLAAVAIIVLITRQVQLARVDREIEAEQVQEVEELRNFAEEGLDPATGQPFGDDVLRLLEVFIGRNVPSDDEGFYALIDGSGRYFSNGSPNLFDPVRAPGDATTDLERVWAATTEPTTRVHDGVPGVGEVRSLAVPLTLGSEQRAVFVVASFPEDDQREVDQLVRVVSLAGLVVVLLTSIATWSIAGRVLQPVRDLSATARRITHTDLSARIPVDGRDELAELGSTFNEMVERLEEGVQQQRRFLDDAAHELRTPITIARGHLEVLGDDPADRAEAVAVVTDELDRMSRFVTDLLTLAKAGQPNFLDLGPVDVGDVMADVQQRLPSLGERDWRVDAQLAPGVLAITADEGRLTQAILNLVQNSVQHTAVGDEIGIGARVQGRVLSIWVRDTGPGVEAELAPEIFERFRRGRASRSGRPDGVGIGLSIVAAIARAHGGEARLDNRGQGATFLIELPVDDDAVPRTWPPPEPSRPTTTPEDPHR